MAKKSGPSGKSGKSSKSKAGRPEVIPIGPALAELLNPAINRGDAGMGSGTGLQPPPDNSWDRRAGGEAAAHRARASTRDKSDDVARRDTSNSMSRGSPPPNPPPQAGEGKGMSAEARSAKADGGAFANSGLEEAPQANYGTSATIPTLDPELARQLGLPTAEDDE